MSGELAARLAGGIEALGLELDPDRQARLLDYLALLTKWNRAYNLTAVRAPAEMVTLHLLDSLSVLPLIRGSRILDVGAGAGLPGVPLAIAAPERRYVLLDSNGKKVRFLRQAIMTLALETAEAVQVRVENYRPEQPFDTVISRAFASLRDFVTLAGRHCSVDGRLLAMKGRYPQEELAGLPRGWRVVEVHRLQVPGLAAARHLVELRRG